jgi:Domain of unknown function (DUF4442)
VKKAVRRHMRMLMNVWPPFLGAEIRVKRLQPDWKEIDVEMKLRRWNSNYVRHSLRRVALFDDRSVFHAHA